MLVTNMPIQGFNWQEPVLTWGKPKLFKLVIVFNKFVIITIWQKNVFNLLQDESYGAFTIKDTFRALYTQKKFIQLTSHKTYKIF